MPESGLCPSTEGCSPCNVLSSTRHGPEKQRPTLPIRARRLRPLLLLDRDLHRMFRRSVARAVGARYQALEKSSTECRQREFPWLRCPNPVSLTPDSRLPPCRSLVERA